MKFQGLKIDSGYRRAAQYCSGASSAEVLAGVWMPPNLTGRTGSQETERAESRVDGDLHCDHFIVRRAPRVRGWSLFHSVSQRFAWLDDETVVGTHVGPDQTRPN